MKKTITCSLITILLTTALFISLVAAAGCGGGGGKPKVMSFLGNSSASAKEMKTILKKMEKKYGDKVTFETIDYDDPANKDILKEYHVSMNPTIIIFNAEGQIKQTFMGKAQEEMLTGAIESYIPSGKTTTGTTPSNMQVQTLPNNAAPGTIPGTQSPMNQ